MASFTSQFAIDNDRTKAEKHCSRGSGGRFFWVYYIYIYTYDVYHSHIVYEGFSPTPVSGSDAVHGPGVLDKGRRSRVRLARAAVSAPEAHGASAPRAHGAAALVD